MTAVPRWRCRFGHHRLVLAQGAVVVHVRRADAGGWRVAVNATGLGNIVQDFDDAKQAGVDLARKILQHATHELDLLRMATR